MVSPLTVKIVLTIIMYVVEDITNVLNARVLHVLMRILANNARVSLV